MKTILFLILATLAAGSNAEPIQLQADLDSSGTLTISGVWGLAATGQVKAVSFGLETIGNPAPLVIALDAPTTATIAAEISQRMAAQATDAAQVATGFGGDAYQLAAQAAYTDLIAEQAELSRMINQAMNRIIQIRAMFSALRGVE